MFDLVLARLWGFVSVYLTKIICPIFFYSSNTVMYFWNFLTNVEELVCASAFRLLGEKRTTSARLYISYCYLWRTLANQQINSLYVIRYSSYLATQICLHFIKLWNTIIHKANYAARTWGVIVMWVMHADERSCVLL